MIKLKKILNQIPKSSQNDRMLKSLLLQIALEENSYQRTLMWNFHYGTHGVKSENYFHSLPHYLFR